MALVITFIYLLSAYFSSVYTIEELLGSGLFEPVLKAVTITWLILAFVIWFYRAFTFPRIVFAGGWLLAIAFIYSWRFASFNLLKINLPEARILIVGTKPIAADIIAKLKESIFGYHLVGIVSDESPEGLFAGVPVIGKTADIVNLLEEHSVNRMIITSSLSTKVFEKLAESGLQNLKIEVVPDLYEILVGKVDYNTLTDIPLLELTSISVKSSYVLLKRLGDIVFAAVLLTVSFPLVILPAVILIKLTSKGPIFFKQERVGREGKVFRVVKLRTMYDDAEKETGPTLAKAKDKRITRVGAFLRKYRLDELPQMVNILKGEMSFVGPRPERPEFVNEFNEKIPGYASRFKLQPGATGLAQISGNYTTDAANKLKYDLFYLYHRSLLLDLKIIFKTIRVMISGTGSH